MTDSSQAAVETRQDTWFPLGRKHRRRVIGAFVLVVVLAALITILLRTVFAVPVLDQGAVQQGVRQVLVEDFHFRHVGDVRCPADQPIEQGYKFTCEVTHAGIDRHATITVTNDTGEYRVDLPE